MDFYAMSQYIATSKYLYNISIYYLPHSSLASIHPIVYVLQLPGLLYINEGICQDSLSKAFSRYLV